MAILPSCVEDSNLWLQTFGLLLLAILLGNALYQQFLSVIE